MMRSPQESMTIAQLKRYMDRRFDRLERTKANKSDLRRFATKDDPKRLEKRFATRFATKADFARYMPRTDTSTSLRKGYAMISRRSRTGCPDASASQLAITEQARGYRAPSDFCSTERRDWSA